MEGEFFVLKSLCIKTKSKNVNNYLLKSFQNLNLENMYVSHSKFKLYENVIIHYTGTDVDSFLIQASDIISDAISQFYEVKILKDIISSNYFYFTDIEQRKILNLCVEYLTNPNLEHWATKKATIMLASQNYFRR